MGVKYRCDYKNYFNNFCRIDISLDSYSGEPILVRGVGDQACIISREVGDDPYDPIISTTATISIYQEDVSLIDIPELQNADDRQFTVQFYIQSELKFTGFMVPDGIQRPVKGRPFDLNITATDGLQLLSGIRFSGSIFDSQKSILNTIMGIIRIELQMFIPIQWVCSLTNDQYPLEEDLFSGSIRYGDDSSAYIDINGNRKFSMEVLEGLLRSMQCRIMQSDGKWIIWRINDVTDGEFIYRELSIDDEITVSPLTDFTRTIGWNNSFDYQATGEDHVCITNKGLKTVITTYDQTQRDNILPNGSMDNWSIPDGVLQWWDLLTPANGSIEQAGSLYEALGYSARVITNPGSPNIFKLTGRIPIDTDILYTYINFGFKFMIEEWAGVDVDGNIVWGDLSPFNIQVTYRNGTDEFYLNEFGSWTTTLTQIYIDIPNFKLLDVTQVDFNKQQEIKIPLALPSPIGQTTDPAIFVNFNLQPGLSVRFDDIYIRTGNNSDVYSAVQESSSNAGKEEYTLGISSSHNGFFFSNLMTNYTQSGLEKFYSDSVVEGMTLTEINSHAILRNRYKGSEIFEGSIYAENYSYAEIYEIESFTDKKFLPLKSSWNTETCVTKISCVEVRNDGTGITTKHYGSNDKTALSN